MDFLVTATAAFIVYLYLTAGSGALLGAWSAAELTAGVATAVVAGFAGRKLLFPTKSFRMLNPWRWLLFLVYLLGPFFWGMARANIDVACRVITGKIRPGIVKIEPGLKTDLALTLLANSITLTPGTLSVDVGEEENSLYVHWIYVRNETPAIEEICSHFPVWARRIAE